ncbi:MAG: hypothetical protein HKP53_09790 [Eudoraea sp.]|nr:hypothetical protein [Eudoraea sp.]
MRYRLLIIILISAYCLQATAQAKYEREYRIKKAEFPEMAHALLANEMPEVKRLKYYRETDSAKTSYEAKLKKDRLHYSIEFDSEGVLEDIEITIKEVDLPNATFLSIREYLSKSYAKYNIRKIQQQYPVIEGKPIKKIVREAFQNLMLPYINYELIVSCKTKDGRQDFEFLFSSEGTFISKRKLLPPNYDHVLY